MLGAKGEAMDKLFSHHRAQIIEIDVPTALVPQGEVLVVGCSGPQDAHSGLVKAHEVIALQGNQLCYSPSQSS